MTTKATLTLEHEETGHKGAFVLAEGKARLAAMTYSRSKPDLVIIDHTEVDDRLRGQGAGRKLLDALVAWARETGTKVIPLCPFAKAQFEKDPSIGDVLAGN